MVLSQVLDIQRSVGWDELDFSIATRRLNSYVDGKFFAVDSENKITGYAIVVPCSDTLYLSQIAVHSKVEELGVN